MKKKNHFGLLKLLVPGFIPRSFYFSNISLRRKHLSLTNIKETKYNGDKVV